MPHSESWERSAEPFGADLDQSDYHQDINQFGRRRTQSENPSSMSMSPYLGDSEHHGNFRVRLDVRQFQPNEVSVQHDGDIVCVHGKHEERTDEHGYISREFTRRYEIPKDVDPDKVSCSWHPNNVLVIKAPRDSLHAEEASSIEEGSDQNSLPSNLTANQQQLSDL